MKYLITSKEFEPFLTSYFNAEMHYVPGMVIYNLVDLSYSENGIDFIEIDTDELY